MAIELEKQSAPIRAYRGELIAVGIFVAVNLIAPLVLGERYPFTVSPMFSDQPSQYCTYEVTDAAGQPLDPQTFGLHLVYDGNPPGLGMGIKPAETLHGFGEVPNESTVRGHVEAVMQEQNLPGPVIVSQHCVRCDEEHRRPVSTQRSWTIERPERP